MPLGAVGGGTGALLRLRLFCSASAGIGAAGIGAAGIGAAGIGAAGIGAAGIGAAGIGATAGVAAVGAAAAGGVVTEADIGGNRLTRLRETPMIGDRFPDDMVLLKTLLSKELLGVALTGVEQAASSKGPVLRGLGKEMSLLLRKSGPNSPHHN